MPSYEPVLLKGSLILVTGVNGFLGSHTANQFLLAGYNVRGQVRNIEKNKSLQEVFDERYGSGRFELVEVGDLSAPDALDIHLKGKPKGYGKVENKSDLGDRCQWSLSHCLGCLPER